MNPLSNLEPIEEGDISLERKFKQASQTEIAGRDETKMENADAAREISAAEKNAAYERILSKVQQDDKKEFSENIVSADAQASFEKNNAEGRIQHLVDLALTKGPVHAVKVAKHLEENYVIDMFHNRMLADELHDAFVKQGII